MLSSVVKSGNFGERFVPLTVAILVRASYLGLMKYQETLKELLEKRMSVNPRYSLRAFASALGLEASKLSEILAEKKGLSAERAGDICERLRLKGPEGELFVLSVQAQHSRSKAQKAQAAAKLKELLAIRGQKKVQTTRHNAWYFGAVKEVAANNLDVQKLKEALRLTALQIESAERFIRRIEKSYPEKERFAYDSLGLLKKINSDFSEGTIENFDAHFLLLTEDEAATLSSVVQKKIESFSRSKNQTDKKSLYMHFNGFSKLCSLEEIC